MAKKSNEKRLSEETTKLTLLRVEREELNRKIRNTSSRVEYWTRMVETKQCIIKFPD